MFMPASPCSSNSPSPPLLSSSPTSYAPTTPLGFPPSPRHSTDMSLAGPNPYASMEIPNVEMVRKESQDLHELRKRDVELVANSMIGAALDLQVREKDKAAIAKLKEAASVGGGGGPKT